MRVIEKAPAVFRAAERSRDTFHVETRTLEFLTPVFGGGVETRAPGREAHKPFDPVTPVRAASIRGQLRFWWRAANPRKLRTVEELAKAEAEIFGAASSPGALSIRIRTQPGRPKEVHVLEGKFGAVHGRDGLAYGAFPLRDTNHAQGHGALHEYRDPFVVELSLDGPARDELVRDLGAALWAWTQFGGLGGRTRRGFGAVRDVDSDEVPGDGWSRLVGGVEAPWPHLPAGKEDAFAMTRQSSRTAVEALNALLVKFREHRQRRRSGDQRNRPGRSYWPEPDAIRASTGRSARKHAHPVTDVHAAPRGAFGMPIIFHFKDRGEGDPNDVTLVPPDKERMASPLILRPGRLPGGSFAGIGVVLRVGAPEHVSKGVLRSSAPTRESEIKITLSPDESERLGSLMEKNGRLFTDPVLRFLEEIRS